MNTAKKNFMGDQQGAIMVMGLFMAVSLIGSLWFILGIGEAIVVRDKAIEAADHAAFSAAAVHARGMNYISALNLIMFALTVIYVGLAIIADILIAVGAVGGWVAWTPPTCEPDGSPLILVPFLGEAAYVGCEVGQIMAKFLEGYAKVLSGIFKGIGALEDVLQVGMPIAAEGAAMTVISDYTPYNGALVSPSLIPGLSQSSKGIGLPLKNQKNQYLCDRAFNLVKDKVTGVIPFPVNKFIGWVIDGIKDVIDFIPPQDTPGGIGCGDGSPWSDENLHIVNDGGGGKAKGGGDAAKNGSDVMQMWALVLNAQDPETTQSERRVGMSAKKGGRGDTQTPKKQIYYSQAEYYFDCSKAWKDTECYDDSEKTASFSMSWRARLRRVYAPSFGNQLIGLGTQFLLSGANPVNMLANVAGNSPAAQNAANSLGNLRNSAGGNLLVGTGAGGGIDTALNFLSGGDRPIH